MEEHTFKVTYTGRQHSYSWLGNFLVEHAKYFQIKDYPSKQDAYEAALKFYNRQKEKVQKIGHIDGSVSLKSISGLKEMTTLKEWQMS